jgi:hypothetical protein
MKTILGITALALVVSGLAGNASAQSATHKHPHVTVHRAPAIANPYGVHWGSDGLLYSSMGSPIPGYVLSQPNECWMEDGYSHWTTCNAD